MKKLLLVFCMAFSITIISKAQITVTQSNMPAIGNVIVEREDTIHAGISIGNASPNSQNWNFSGWINNSQTTSGFVDPSTLSGFSNFPASNFGINDGSGISSFANAGATSFDLIGMYGDITGTGTNTALKINPGIKLITVPSTYNTSYNGTFNYVIQIAYSNPPMDSIKITASSVYTSIIDAWGTITTPSHSNVNAIRQKYREIKTQTTFIHVTLPFPAWQQSGQPTVDTTFTYRWWSNTFNIPVAEVETNNADSITAAKWNHSYLPGTVEINENSFVKTEVKVFPNPATETINITGISEASAIVISDVTGKVISGSILTNINNSINISNFNNGIYFYQINDAKGNVISKSRFVVAK